MYIFIFLYLEILLFSTLLYILNSAYYKSSSRRALLDDVYRDCVHSAVPYSCTESDEYNSNNSSDYQILTNGSKAAFCFCRTRTFTFIKSSKHRLTRLYNLLFTSYCYITVSNATIMGSIMNTIVHI